MILIIQPITDDIQIIGIMDGDISVEEVSKKGDDFSTFPDTLMKIIQSHTIEEIWCICGPGAFTRMRIVTLTINTIHLALGIPMKGCHFFDIIDRDTPILRANDKEYLMRGEGGDISIIDKNNIPPGRYRGYGSENDFTDTKVFIEYTLDIPYIIDVFSRKEYSPTLSPLYFKEPHITWSKKNTSHS